MPAFKLWWVIRAFVLSCWTTAGTRGLVSAAPLWSFRISFIGPTREVTVFLFLSMNLHTNRHKASRFADTELQVIFFFFFEHCYFCCTLWWRAQKCTKIKYSSILEEMSLLGLYCQLLCRTSRTARYVQITSLYSCNAASKPREDNTYTLHPKSIYSLISPYLCNIDASPSCDYWLY